MISTANKTDLKRCTMSSIDQYSAQCVTLHLLIEVGLIVRLSSGALCGSANVFHAGVRGSFPGLGGLKKKMFVISFISPSSGGSPGPI